MNQTDLCFNEDDDYDNYDDYDDYREIFQFNEITPNDCCFIMIDIQDKFKDIIHDMESVIRNADILNRAAEILKIPLIVTEQSPEKLGKTIENIYVPKSHKYFQKTKFSGFIDEVEEFIEKKKKLAVVVYGIEAHICVTQTCLDALSAENHVILVEDATSSRKENSKKVAMKLLRDSGIDVVTTEMLLFMLLRDATHPKFKEISKLVK